MEHVFEVAILSIVQGVTEFLPVSSSGHLVICKNLLGLNTPGADLEVALHFGTLLSVLVYYRKSICGLAAGICRLESAAWRRTGALALSAVPVAAVYFAFGSSLEKTFEDPALVRWTGAFLAATGVLLCATRFMPQGKSPVTAWKGFAMGCAQAVALLPGVSRSGSTLSAARALKAGAADAAEFSFLMCAPLIAGAALLKLLSPSAPAEGCIEVGAAETCAGVAIAAVSGYFALAFLVRIFKSRFFWLFGPYCIAAGLTVFFCLR